MDVEAKLQKRQDSAADQSLITGKQLYPRCVTGMPFWYLDSPGSLTHGNQRTACCKEYGQQRGRATRSG